MVMVLKLLCLCLKLSQPMNYPLIQRGIVTLDKPFEVIANSYEEYHTPVYAVSFSKDEFSEDIKTFESLHDATEYKNNILQEHGLNQMIS